MTKTEYDSKQADWIEEREKINKLEDNLKQTKEKFSNFKNKVMLFLEA
jgi:hypothetical protein